MQKEDGSTSIHTYNKVVDAVTDLSNGRLDAVILDKNPAEVFASEYDGIASCIGRRIHLRSRIRCAGGSKWKQYGVFSFRTI